MDVERLESILSRYEGYPQDLIPILQEIQDQYHYLPKDELKEVAQRINVPLTRVYSVATFYKMFSLTPKGRHQLRVCLGTTCHLKGGQRLLESMTSHLGIEPGYTTPDMQFSLETVGCLGSCAQAPVMMVDDKYYARMTIDKVPKILKLYKE
ncbi:MAG: NADH-quinone oxidoreductase subunit NuoE [Deltaproteobacteria bacterium]|nr:NADH-quinone oxidoreductase subunit NuoE [Deltaproteobacteria bacterium]MBW1986755.1 NADH-quinone oxidoreductase subunit NuoE [Deltaproteobacteria bacterium]MBW2135259.1 NADH-quinone oxidoreductase subunit NuoE [Deltaproteobacteria bacterium]